MVVKRRMDIERVLGWAYREELPKERTAVALVKASAPNGYGSGWGPGSKNDLLADIDAPRNRYGVVPDFSAVIGPHPDAVMVHQAVEALEGLELELPEGWNPLRDLGDFRGHEAAAIASALERLSRVDEKGRRWLKAAPRVLVQHHALLGRAPDWSAEQPVLKMRRTHNGQPRWFRKVWRTIPGAFGPLHTQVVLDGYDERKKRPWPGAYNEYYLDPDPVPAALSRAEFEVWHAALGVLVEDLAGRLETIDVAGCLLPARPWETESIAPRVLADLSCSADGCKDGPEKHKKIRAVRP